MNIRNSIFGIIGASGLLPEPKAYLTHFDPDCLRNPLRNSYRAPPKFVEPQRLQSTEEYGQLDFAFLKDAEKSQDGIPTEVLSNIAIDLFAVTLAASRASSNATVEGQAMWKPPRLNFEYLPFLDLWIIHRDKSISHADFRTVLDGIPCTRIAPTPEKHRSIDPEYFNDTEESTKAFLRRHRSTRFDPRSSGRLHGNQHVAELSAFPYSSERLPELFKNGSLVDTFWKKPRTLQHAQSPSVSLRLPSDSLIGKQWYLFGDNQGVPFGANIVDAWAASVLVNKLRGHLDHLELGVIDFSHVLQSHPGMTVALADSGCTNNLDLVNKMDYLPGCPQNGELKQNTHCSGYDYGNDSFDMTQSIESHGTQTAGLVGAESDNVWGISATCPMCKVICLKIYNDQTRSLTTTAIVRAIEHIAQSGVKISNHSYGGFGDDRLERFAFERLTRAGNHLAFVAAGNAGCNIDCGKPNNNCLGKRCSSAQIWTPASYQMPGLISIASSTKKGTVSLFSNVGSNSVHLFTPGSEIVSIDKKGSALGTVGSGTSFASPIAAGIAAFIWSVFPNASALDVQNAIISTTKYNAGFEGLAKNPGTIDAFAALDYLWKTTKE